MFISLRRRRIALMTPITRESDSDSAGKSSAASGFGNSAMTMLSGAPALCGSAW